MGWSICWLYHIFWQMTARAPTAVSLHVISGFRLPLKKNIGFPLIFSRNSIRGPKKWLQYIMLEQYVHPQVHLKKHKLEDIWWSLYRCLWIQNFQSFAGEYTSLKSHHPESRNHNVHRENLWISWLKPHIWILSLSVYILIIVSFRYYHHILLS